MHMALRDLCNVLRRHGWLSLAIWLDMHGAVHRHLNPVRFLVAVSNGRLATFCSNLESASVTPLLVPPDDIRAVAHRNFAWPPWQFVQLVCHVGVQTLLTHHVLLLV